MSSAAPRSRQGLIALLVARRVKAERERRRLLAEAKAQHDAEAAQAAQDAGKKAKRSGWFRR
jgi:secreted protein with Ig-like and vWFA domain